jgi:hypothetical protein
MLERTVMGQFYKLRPDYVSYNAELVAELVA